MSRAILKDAKPSWGYLGPCWGHPGAIFAHLGAILAIFRAILGYVGASSGHTFGFKMMILVVRCIKNEQITMSTSSCCDILSSRGRLDLIFVLFGHFGITSLCFDALPFKRASPSHAKTGLSSRG